MGTSEHEGQRLKQERTHQMEACSMLKSAVRLPTSNPRHVYQKKCPILSKHCCPRKEVLRVEVGTETAGFNPKPWVTAEASRRRCCQRGGHDGRRGSPGTTHSQDGVACCTPRQRSCQEPWTEGPPSSVACLCTPFLHRTQLPPGTQNPQRTLALPKL